ncbi:MAG: acyltransferase [Spirochaetales bacterium]|nr:acyltransferase [Spirochaetales bacterium]
MTIDTGLTATLVYGVAFILFVGFSWVPARWIGLPAPTGRNVNLDGLRGLAALGVFFHHFALTYRYHQTGRWELTPSHLFNISGQGSVIIFFMITGYLFWGKISRAEGRPDWRSLYLSRLFRLAPLYWVVVVYVVAVALLSTAGAPINWGELSNQVLSWVLFQQQDIHGFHNTWMSIAGVNWTLIYEWTFYFLLPLLAALYMVARRSRWVTGLLLVAGLFVTIQGFNLFTLTSSGSFLYFILGGLTYSWGQNPRLKGLVKAASHPAAVAVPVIALTLLLVFYHEAYGLPQALLMFLVFAPIAWGCSLGGLLKIRPIRLLGEISYSVYLLQGVVLYLAFTVLWPTFFVRPRSVEVVFASLLASGMVLILLSTLTFRFIEAPFIRWGKKVAEAK